MDEGTDLGRASAVFPAPLAATSGMQAMSLQSSLNSVSKDMGKSRKHELEDEADLVSDPESSISSEIEEAPSTSPREQYSTASGSTRLEFCFKLTRET